MRSEKELRIKQQKREDHAKIYNNPEFLELKEKYLNKLKTEIIAKHNGEGPYSNFFGGGPGCTDVVVNQIIVDWKCNRVESLFVPWLMDEVFCFDQKDLIKCHVQL